MSNGEEVHEFVLFGIHGGHLNITDGEFLYMLAPDTVEPLFEYTLMPTVMNNFYPKEYLSQAKLVSPFSFTKNLPLLKFPARGGAPGGEEVVSPETLLFNLKNDPAQEHPLNLTELPSYFPVALKKILQENDAPEELYIRYGL